MVNISDKLETLIAQIKTAIQRKTHFDPQKKRTEWFYAINNLYLAVSLRFLNCFWKRFVDEDL